MTTMDSLQKSNLILLVAAAALAVPTFLVLRSEIDLYTNPERVPLLFEGFTSDNVGAIAMGEPKPGQVASPPGPDGQRKPIEREMLQINRSDKGWVLGGQNELAGAPVFAVRVRDDILAHLEKMRCDPETIVAKDASDEVLARYGLAEHQAFVIRAVDRSMSATLADLLVGKDASDGKFGTDVVRGFYVRKADSRDVVLYEVHTWRRGLIVDEWLDATLLRTKPASVRRFSLQNEHTGDKPVVFARKPGSEATWVAEQAPEGMGALRQIEAEQLVQMVHSLRGYKFRMPLPRANLVELGLQPPRIEIVVTTEEDGTEKVHRLQGGNAVEGHDDEVYFVYSELPFLLTSSKHELDVFGQDPRKWFDPAPENPKPPKAGEEPPVESGGKPPADKPVDKPPGDLPADKPAVKPGDKGGG